MSKETQFHKSINHHPTPARFKYKPGYFPGCPNKPTNPCPPAQNPFAPWNGMPLAQAYIPIQPCDSPQYDLAKALEAGTLFSALDKPYKCK